MSPRPQNRGVQKNKYSTPRTLGAVATLQSQMANLLRKRDLLIGKFAEERSVIDEAEKKAVTPIEEEIFILAEAIRLFAYENKAELTGKGEKKTIDTGSGCFRWYMAGPRAWIKKGDDFIARVKELGHHELVRTTEEPNKAALIELHKTNPALITEIGGCSVKQHEKFVVEPANAQWRAAYNQKKKNWVLAKT